MIVECSKWLFPAIIASGWLAPVIGVLSWLWEGVQKWL